MSGESKGMGFFRWGVNWLAWTVIGAVASGGMLEHKGAKSLEQVAQAASEICMGSENPASRSACVLKVFNDNEKDIKLKLFEIAGPMSSLKVQVGNQEVSMRVDTIQECRKPAEAQKFECSSSFHFLPK